MKGNIMLRICKHYTKDDVSISNNYYDFTRDNSCLFTL